MISKVREKVFVELNNVADNECSSCGDEIKDMGTIHEDLINLAYRYAPIKELKKLIVDGKQMIKNRDEEQ